MRRIALLTLSLLALALAGAAGLFLLSGPGPVVPAPPLPAPSAARSVDAPAAPPSPAGGVSPGEEPRDGAEGPPADDGVLPPGDYPWRVPAWWRATEARLAAAHLAIEPGPMELPRILERVAAAAGIDVRVGPELEAWAADRTYALARVDGSALAFVDLLASVHNLEVVLLRDGAVLHQRGRAPDTAVVRSGRVQWTLRVARERRAGEREPDPAEEDLLAAAPRADVAGGVAPGRSYTVRDLLPALSRSLDLPVFVDEALWNANPSVAIPAPVPESTGDLLRSVAPPLGARFEITPRRAVLFRP